MSTAEAVILDVQLTARTVAPSSRPVTPASPMREDSPFVALVDLLTERVERALMQALGGDPLSVADLKRILREPTDVGAIVALLEHAVTASSIKAVNPLAAAKARWLRAEQLLLDEAGGTLTVESVAELLGGIKRQAVEKRRNRGTLLGLRKSGGAYVYPVCQFHHGEVLPGLEKFLAAFPQDTDPWQKLNVLLGASDALEGKRPLDALRGGHVEDAVEVAASAFEERVSP